MKHLRTALVVSFVAVISEGAFASWTVTNLHPAAGSQSSATACSGAMQAGTTSVGGLSRASRWSGTAASWVNLHPAAASTSSVSGAAGINQVGNANVGGVVSASLWSGSAASWVNLHPAGATQSQAYGASGATQVGVARISNIFQAGRWSGSAASWVSLHPAEATGSVAHAASATQQVGFATLPGGLNRASLWSGTAGSWINLHPVTTGQSVAYGINGSSQVGYTTAPSNGAFNAALWSGTSASWVNLHPAGSVGSIAYGVLGSTQVGVAAFSGQGDRAVLWTSSASSWVNLHNFLPAGYSRSRADAISSDGVNTYIVGTGFNTLTGRDEALLWSQPINPPTLAGNVVLNDWLPTRDGQVMQFQVRPVGGTSVLASFSATLDGAGNYTATLPGTLAAGTYDVACRGSHWLRRKVGSVVIGATGATGVNFTLFNGDADASGEVDAADIDLVIADFGGNGVMTDLDGSTEVDAADIDIAIANFGQSDE